MFCIAVRFFEAQQLSGLLIQAFFFDVPTQFRKLLLVEAAFGVYIEDIEDGCREGLA